MDRIESRTRLDEIDELIKNNNIDEAKSLLNDVNWVKIHNVSSLLRASELFEKIGEYREARNLLEIAHERSPVGRMIIFRLAIVSIRLGELSDAKEYYDEFLEVAPHDSLKYMLNFEISKANGESDLTLIAILEELKANDFTEEWAFELACLYHKTGQVEKCIQLCDEIILWFGDGPYVEKALEMKLLYQPLDGEQEEKYRKMQSVDSKMTEIRPNDSDGGGEILSHTIRIPEIDIKSQERFNTTNLQAEIKKNIEEIMQASEMGEVSDNMDAIKDLVDDIPYLKVREEENSETQALKDSNTQKIGELLKDRYNKYLSEEFDGQMSLFIPEESPEEVQVDGQMTIEEVMGQWEKTKRAAEASLSDAKEMELLQYKERAIKEASLVLKRLMEVAPKLDAGVPPAQLLKDEYLSKNDSITEPQKVEKEAVQSQEIIKKEQEVAKEEDKEPQEIDIEKQEEVRDREALKEGKTFKIPKIAAEGNPEGDWEIPIISVEDEKEDIKNEIDVAEAKSDEIDSVDAKDWDPPELKKAIEDVNNILQNQIDQLMAEVSENDESISKEKEDIEETEPVDENLKEVEPVVSDESVIETENIQTQLTETEKRVFSYFSLINGMEAALCQLLTGLRDRLSKDSSSHSGNIIIQGRRGSGKTRLAMNILKVIQSETGKPAGQIGKISGEKLNEKDVRQLFDKIRSGCLIIEGASALEKETIVTLSLMMESDQSGILVVLEDTRAQIEKLLAMDGRFAKKFTEKINIPVMTIDELVGFGKVYAKENGYDIDDMGVLALYDRINLSQNLEKPSTIIDVKEIIDAAIDSQKNGKSKGLFKIFGSKSQETEGLVLQEKDFQDE